MKFCWYQYRILLEFSPCESNAIFCINSRVRNFISGVGIASEHCFLKKLILRVSLPIKYLNDPKDHSIKC